MLLEAFGAEQEVVVVGIVVSSVDMGIPRLWPLRVRVMPAVWSSVLGIWEGVALWVECLSIRDRVKAKHGHTGIVDIDICSILFGIEVISPPMIAAATLSRHGNVSVQVANVGRHCIISLLETMEDVRMKLAPFIEWMPVERSVLRDKVQ